MKKRRQFYCDLSATPEIVDDDIVASVADRSNIRSVSKLISILQLYLIQRVVL